jgi:WD40 repeat protein
MQHTSGLPLIAVACTPDGRLAVASSSDGTVALRRGGTGEDRGGWAVDPAHALTALAFLPDGRTLVSAEQDGKVRLRDLGAALADGPLDPAASSALSHAVRELDAGGAAAFSLAVSPDGKHIASGTSRLRLFDAATGALERDIKGTSPIASIAFSPDGSLVATGNADRTVRVYDAATGAERATLTGHPGRVHAVAFSDDGQTLASAGEGETVVRLWDVARLAPAGQLVGHADVVNALVSPGRGLIVSSSDDDVMLVWRLPARSGAARPGG